MNELGSPSPLQAFRIKDWAIDADALVVPAIGRLHRRHAAKADADAAGHWRFQREMARDAAALGLLREGVQHRLRDAAEEMLRRLVLSQEVGDEAVMADRAVVG